MNWTSKTLNSTNCSNDDFKFPVFIHSYSLIMSFGFIGNAVALYVFVKLTHRKTANTVFMSNLAISDLFFTLTLPYRILYYSQREWKLSSFLCSITTYAYYVNLYSSIFFLTALSIFRYIAVLHPLRSKSLVTLRRALLVSLGIWIFVGLACVPFLHASSQLRDGRYRCFEPTVMSWQQILKLNYFALVVGFLLPFLTIIACYTRIIQRLRTSGETLQSNMHARRKSIYMIVFVLSSFLFCFLPYHIIRTVHLHLMVQQRMCQVMTIVIEKMIVVTVCLAAANSCFNPLLYYFVGQNFQNTIKTSTVHRSRSMNSRIIVSQ